MGLGWAASTVGAASAAMGACLNLARCRGIADRVGSHKGRFHQRRDSIAHGGSRPSYQGPAKPQGGVRQ